MLGAYNFNLIRGVLIADYAFYFLKDFSFYLDVLIILLTFSV